MSTNDEGKKYRLLQAECYKGHDVQTAESQAGSNKERTNAKLLAASLTKASIQKKLLKESPNVIMG